MTDARLSGLAELTARFYEEPSVDDTVRHVLGCFLEVVGGEFAGIVFQRGRNRVEVGGVTDPLFYELERLGRDLGEGPGAELMGDQCSVVVPDCRAEGRWPRWARSMAGHGVRSVLGVRLRAASTALGDVTLYDRRPGRFAAGDEDVARIVARHAALAVNAARTTENLWRAVDARRLIGQAQGILMERYRLDPDQAFGVLRRYSQDRNTKLQVVAQNVVSGLGLPD
ncbi:MAG: GAF and ANTAR domain-containing protein [Nocardioides sp.]